MNKSYVTGLVSIAAEEAAADGKENKIDADAPGHDVNLPTK